MSVSEKELIVTEDNYPNLKGTIFIVTYGRSGSTLLQSILQTIPGALIRGENYLAMESLFIANRRVTKTVNMHKSKKPELDHPWYGADKIDVEQFNRKMVDAFIDEVLQPDESTRWLGFKEIRYPMTGKSFESFLLYMQTYYKNPIFVFNSRNAEDVSISAWLKKSPKKKVLEKVRTMDRKFRDFCSKYPHISHHVTFEDLLADPGCLRPLFEKMGEKYDADKVAKVLQKKLIHGHRTPKNK